MLTKGLIRNQTLSSKLAMFAPKLIRDYLQNLVVESSVVTSHKSSFFWCYWILLGISMWEHVWMFFSKSAGCCRGHHLLSKSTHRRSLPLAHLVHIKSQSKLYMENTEMKMKSYLEFKGWLKPFSGSDSRACHLSDGIRYNYIHLTNCKLDDNVI